MRARLVLRIPFGWAPLLAAACLALLPGFGRATVVSNATVHGQYTVTCVSVGCSGMVIDSDSDADSQLDPLAASAALLPGPPASGGELRSFVGSASATPIVLRVKANLDLATQMDDTFFEMESEASAARVDELVFTGPPGETSVAASLGIQVDGVLSADGTLPGRCCAQVGIQVQLNGQVAGAILADSTPSAQTFPPGVVSDVTLAGNRVVRGIHGTFATTPIQVPLGMPVPFQLSVYTRDTISERTYGPPTDDQIQLEGDFSDTVALASPGHVFDLPDGYSVSSTSGAIVDNVAVPEPSAPAAASIALAATAALAGKRRPGWRP